MLLLLRRAASKLLLRFCNAASSSGIIASGMIPKVDSAVTAINAGVDKVALVDGRINHSVLLEIFTDKGVGTEIVK